MHLPTGGFILEVMNELDEVWAQMLTEALAKAQHSGNQDVAAYLALKAGNDLIRKASVQWLFDALLEIAAFANRREGKNITIENKNPHRFQFKNATLAGSLLSLRQGVRCLTLEAGWTRAPGDGFMRGGALAVARISHFGISKRNSELFLIAENNSPRWFTLDKNGARAIFDSRNLNEHFQIFLGAN